MGSQWRPDTFYTRLPARKITRRLVYCSPATGTFPEGYWVEFRIELECGHEIDNRNQKTSARCYMCGPSNPVNQPEES